MAKMVYDERYGELTFALRAAIRKHNISKSTYDQLTAHYGQDNHADILAGIKNHLRDGKFNLTDFWKTIGVELV